jgi:membrane-associated phospholipid phosphatase
MAELLQLDETLFYWINHLGKTDFLDWLLPYLRNKYTWIPLYVLLLIVSVWKWKWKGLLLILCLGATVGIGDFISHEGIKKTVQRPRPCRNAELAETRHLLINCGGGYSFTSNHATNHFAVAFFLIGTMGLAIRWIKWPLIIWAASIAYAQVYVGVHYPFDVLAGALLGSTLGWLSARLFRKWGGFPPVRQATVKA